MYNSVLRGYLNYYSFTHNYNKVASSLTHLLRESCARLLAAKFTLRNRARVFKKYGQDLRGKDKAGFLKPDLKLKPWDFNTNAQEYLSTLYASHLSVASLANLTCVKCGTKELVEMHHVRKMSELNPKVSEIDRIMIKARRKQVPLCRNCHLEHHKTETPWKSKNKKREDRRNPPSGRRTSQKRNCKLQVGRGSANRRTQKTSTLFVYRLLSCQ